MSGYLEQYGAGDERREKIIKRVLIAAAAVVVFAGTLWLLFRNYNEENRMKAFLEDLRKQDYKSAYTLWGCTDAQPCRDYQFEKFLEDWGPRSSHASLASLRVVKTRSCAHSVIQILDFGGGEEVNLMVDRKTLAVGFAPWPVCNPVMKVP
jgi:hypothetical protein